MNLLTHLRMSIKLKRLVASTFQVKIDTVAFMLGSIKPDISHRFSNVPHKKKDADKYIYRRIRNILDTDLYKRKKSPVEFSEDLGIIMHYITDFFCFAHSERFKGGIIKHLLYEFKMMFSKSYSKKIRSFDTGLKASMNAVDICKYIDNLHERYTYDSNGEQQCTDMEYAFSACKFLCFSIVSSCMEEYVYNTVKIILPLKI